MWRQVASRYRVFARHGTRDRALRLLSLSLLLIIMIIIIIKFITIIIIIIVIIIVIIIIIIIRSHFGSRMIGPGSLPVGRGRPISLDPTGCPGQCLAAQTPSRGRRGLAGAARLAAAALYHGRYGTCCLLYLENE